MAQEGGAPQGGGFEGMLPMLIMMMLVMGVFIFFSRRSQKRQQTEVALRRSEKALRDLAESSETTP